MICDRPLLRVVAITPLLLALNACSILNPYKEKFLCEGKAGFGRCASVAEAYGESLGLESPPVSPPATPAQNAAPASDAGQSAITAPVGHDNVEAVYRRSMHAEVAALLQAPATPLTTSGHTIRVLLMPYKDTVDGHPALFMARHVYLRVADPEWVLGNYLTEPGEAGRGNAP